MKEGLRIGQTAEIEITVTHEMRAHFPDEDVHDLFSTASLVHMMEWAARKTIKPYLEPHEEGMGSHVDVHHIMLTPVGMRLKIKATITDIRDKKIECEVEASNVRGKVAKGIVVQAIVEKRWVEQKMREMSLIDGIARQSEAVQRPL